MAYGHCVVLCALSLANLISFTDSTWNRPGPVTVCGVYGCRVPVFKYVIVNKLVQPNFVEAVNFSVRINQKLIKYMETVVLEKPDQFKNFSVTFSSPYGYFVDQMNGVRGNYQQDRTYWSILNQAGPIPVGVSSYIPINGDIIIFNFTKD